jgi:hypothetical protein
LEASSLSLSVWVCGAGVGGLAWIGAIGGEVEMLETLIGQILGMGMPDREPPPTNGVLIRSLKLERPATSAREW